MMSMLSVEHLGILPLSGSVALLLLAVFQLYRKLYGGTSEASIGWRPMPQPKSLPIVKNLFQIDLREPLTSIHDLANSYRDCLRLELPNASVVMINSHRLYDEVCDNKRFHKEPTGALYEARLGSGDGLFTAYTDEENWGIAHRILTPIFGQVEVKEVFDQIYDKTCQLVDKWSQFSPGTTFNPYAEFNKFALDVIAEVGFDLQLNSLDTKDTELHPFAEATTLFLSESGKRALRPWYINRYVLRDRNRRYWNAIKTVQGLAKEAIDKRKQSMKKRNDILNAILNNHDPATGMQMGGENRVFNTLSLLGAGLESVSSMLSWIIILLLQNEHCLHKLRTELDERLGDRRITKDDIDDLPYLVACVRETLRLYPGAIGHTLKVREGVATGPDRATGLGKEQYLVSRADTIRVNLLAIQRDPVVWGDDAEVFKPERMLEEKFKALPRNAWKPFGTGVRICIGRFFALQEAYIVVATLIRYFDFVLLNKDVKYRIGETVILQPIGCEMQVSRRKRA